MEESVAEIDTNAVRQRLQDEKARLERDIYERTEGDEATQTVDPITEISGPGVEDADDADALSDNERNQGIVDAERETLARGAAAARRGQVRHLRALWQDNSVASARSDPVRDTVCRGSGAGRA